MRRLLLLLLLIGTAARVGAPAWNALPHGDVHLDLQTVRELAAGNGLRTPLERSVELYAPVDDRPGHPLDQHPPLVVLLSAPLVPLTGDPYRALQVVSVVAALLSILGAAWSAGRVLGTPSALPAAAVVSASYLLVDFAGNGSIYALQSLLVVLLPGLATLRGGSVLAGAVAGLAWLTNYQAAVCVAAVALAPILARGRRGVGGAALAALGFAAVALPWWLRNLEVFQDPFFSVNPLYLRARLGGALALVDEGVGLRLVLEGPTASAFAVALVKNLVVNVRFVLTQTPLWLGPLALAAAAGAVVLVRRGRRLGEVAPVLAVLLPVLHLATMLLWPACKFRYFVPLVALAVLPALAWFRDPGTDGERRGGRLVMGGLALLIGLVALERLARGAPLDGLIVLAALGVAVVAVRAPARALATFVALQAVLAVAAAPAGSTYYDGILVSDVFGRRDAEAADRARQEELAVLARRLTPPSTLAGAVVVADVEWNSYLPPEVRVVQPPPFEDPAALERVGVDLRRRFPEFLVLVEGDVDAEPARRLRTAFRLEERPLAVDGAYALFRALP